jgi:hypothetical protein
MRRKHVPQRTCIGCRQVGGKRELIRLIRTPEGSVEVDETGKRPGRGAYLHRRRSCWETALQKELYRRALKLSQPPAPENLARLQAYAQTLPEQGA